MRFYRRRRFNWRRKWRRWPRYSRRSIWRTRSRTRRRTVRRRKRRYPKRKRRVATFWDPASKKRCNITGWMIELYANWNSNVTCRMYRQNIYDLSSTRKVFFEGGGMSLFTFSLKFLWRQHRLFQNFWSASNDGYDLAKYLSTTFYLPPLRDNTYIFWWDVDYNTVKREDFWRTQPSLLLAWKNKVIIRPRQANNHRTRKVTIKPPATITNQWRYQGSWMDMGLFLFGITLLDWTFPFGPGKDAKRVPWVGQIPCWKVDNPGGASSSPNVTSATLFYAHWRDNGQDNWLTYRAFVGPNTNPTELPNLAGFTKIHEASDLPYWITLWGQNNYFDFDELSAKEGLQKGWCMIYWPEYKSSQDVMKMQHTVPQKQIYLLNAAAMYQLSTCGPFVQSSNVNAVEIPILYKSRWVWGGASFNTQPINKIINFAPTQVAVRNPATIDRSIITPWDCDHHGVLTEEALKRFLEPSGGVDARRPLPIEEQLKEDDPYTSSASSAEESETDEEGPKNQQELTKAIKRCRARILREQHERHRLKQLFRSLIKQE
nr:ORF1 [Torque teno felis virus]